MLPCKSAAETVMITFDFEPTVVKLGLADTTVTPTVAFDPITPDGSDLTETHGPVVVGLKVHVWVGDGTPGQSYRCSCKATFLNLETRELEDVLPVV